MIVKYLTGKSAYTDETILNDGYDINIAKFNPYSSQWGYDSIEKQYGIKINQFRKAPIVLELELKFRGTKEGIATNLNDFYDKCEADIFAKKEGKLYVGDYYVKGYFISRQTIPSADFYGKKQTLQFLVPSGFWNIEKVLTYGPEQKEEIQTLDYSHDYPFDLGYATKAGSWSNDFINDANFELTIYGATANPHIKINGIDRGVRYSSLREGERLVINSEDLTVYKIGANGTRTNLFNQRFTEKDMFAKIESGKINFVYPDTKLRLKLIGERSEPKW